MQINYLERKESKFLCYPWMSGMCSMYEMDPYAIFLISNSWLVNLKCRPLNKANEFQH